MPIETGPNGALYQASVRTEPCEGGFKAQVWRVIYLLPASETGTEVPHEPFPEHFAKSRSQAERMAKAHFKVWAQIQKLAGKRRD
jgi:hypothetical protein